MIHGTVLPAQIIPFIKDLNFPANKNEIIQHVQDKKANQEVLKTLEELPNQKYKSTQEIEKSLAYIQREY